ncbi:YeaH/YhbH family protein [Roseovarius sp. Pro17]|uniref:YeaH/YhbH family protein n=1 Tax=Roseovarius sp. Pro17 TaxID=3108175 RepID=UPI002D7A227B|nr:YeaH/YhbH family protein [Roseovarius sp. Pro17]
MAHLVDRRLNPKGKSHGNRRRFIGRVRAAVKNAVDESVRNRDIADADGEKMITVPAKGIAEPSFRHAAKGGRRQWVLSGNRSFSVGDRIRKPPSGAPGGGGREGSADGEGEDDFLFLLTRNEFLELYFEDLELPDLVKRSLKEIKAAKPIRMGYTVAGTPANLSVMRTMRNAYGRRIAMRRPKIRDLDDLILRIQALEALDMPDAAELAELGELRERVDLLRKRQRSVPFVDPLDVRYKFFEMRPEPSSKAVMFCLMDVSASMGEREKDLAKRFFVLLHLFLKQRYDKIELVFIRHTQTASEVDEETFFHSRETGGTVVSTALKQMKEVINQRYPPSEWNIYAAQASDGENYGGDSEVCADLLQEALMPLCQYFAYIEILQESEVKLMNSDDNGMELWRAYRKVAGHCPNFAMKRIATPADIYPVFRELFVKKGQGVSDA